MRRIEMRFALAVVLVGCHASPAPTTRLVPVDDPAPTFVAVDPDAPRVTKLAINEGVVCALIADGTVRCWGDNLEGALGDGTNIERHTPVVVNGVDHAVDIAASLAGACARIADGSVKCWGSTLFADELAHEPDGSVGWPQDATNNQAHPIALLAGSTALWFGSIGDGCARGPTGAIRCWGSGVGELAAGHPANLGNAPAPVVRSLEHATAIAISEYLACATMVDHTATCWGQNDRHQIGDGTTEQRLQPTPVRGLRDVVQVAVGRESACALIAGGTVRCWGSNDAGQLGDGTTTERATPVEVKGVRGVTALFSGPLDVCAIVAGGAVTCWGWNRAGQLGDGNSAEASGPVTVVGLDHVRQIALALTHSCALRDSGEVRCWGHGWRGVIGDGLQADRATPTPVRWTVAAPAASPLPASVGVTSVAVSGVHTCASLSDGTVRCWGRNDEGMVDARSGAPKAAYERPALVAGITAATSVAVDGFDSFARLADGHVVTWGRHEPVHDLGIAPAAAFVNGDGVECTLRDHTATCLLFGVEPKKATIANATQVVAGSMTACALLADRTVACAGVNNHGQVGDGSTIDRDAFVRVPGVGDAVQLAIGDYQACARLGDGTITCWGDVEMTGMGGAIQTHPSKVTGLAGIVDLVAGPSSLCARKRDGSVACWGFYRPVSLGTSRDHWYSGRPIDQPWLRGATLLVLGRNQSCAVLPAGLACWGKNDAGQLGDGTMDDRDEATPVRW